jgi:hypothetical protein
MRSFGRATFAVYRVKIVLPRLPLGKEQHDDRIISSAACQRISARCAATARYDSRPGTYQISSTREVHLKTIGNNAGQQEIASRIARLSYADGAKWGRMSAHQTICHLRDSYCIALGERTASPATGFLQRTLLKWAALWLPLKWMKGFPTRPELEQGRGGSAPTEFESDRNALQAVLGRFCHSLPQPCSPHPVFGAMTRREWWR